jgi:5-methylcytosine-specific restriction protein A
MDNSNPNWVRDELILALDLYFEIEFRRNRSEKNPRIEELSKHLNALPIHKEHLRGRDFRNPTGVYMKLSNFLRFDPAYSGGWRNKGARLDEEVWNEFASDLPRLHRTAQAIKEVYDSLTIFQIEHNFEHDEEFPEGKILTRLHRIRERKVTLIKRKKEQVLKEKGKLECEVCGFNFQIFYGELGKGFAECHHIIPLSALKAEQKTKLSELAIVCANCHRMLHKSREWRSINDLKSLLAARS